MLKWIAALGLLSLGVACSDLERVEQRNADGIVTERYSRSGADSVMQGEYEAFDDLGRRIEKANYDAGQLDGERTLYYPSGEVQYTETHVAGTFAGPYRSYYPQGQLQLEGEYVDNKMAGVWTGYYPNGTKKEEVTFNDNEENGPFREWYSNGVIKAEGEYAEGDHEQGELLLYDLAGELQKRMHCEAGICRTVWQSENSTREG